MTEQQLVNSTAATAPSTSSTLPVSTVRAAPTLCIAKGDARRAMHRYAAKHGFTYENTNKYREFECERCIAAAAAAASAEVAGESQANAARTHYVRLTYGSRVFGKNKTPVPLGTPFKVYISKLQPTHCCGLPPSGSIDTAGSSPIATDRVRKKKAVVKCAGLKAPLATATTIRRLNPKKPLRGTTRLSLPSVLGTQYESRQIEELFDMLQKNAAEQSFRYIRHADRHGATVGFECAACIEKLANTTKSLTKVTAIAKKHALFDQCSGETASSFAPASHSMRLVYSDDRLKFNVTNLKHGHVCKADDGSAQTQQAYLRDATLKMCEQLTNTLKSRETFGEDDAKRIAQIDRLLSNIK